MKNKAIPIIIAVALSVGAALALGCHYFRQPDDRSQESADGELRQETLKEIPLQTDEVRLLFCGVDYSQELTDVIIYGLYDPKAGSVKLLSIPRDTFLGDEYPTGKINQVYKTTGRIETLEEEITERFHLPIDYYITITLESVGEIIDEIGGVPITLDQDIYDMGVKLFEAGEQVLSGEQAQLFIRQRHAYATADLGRIEAQHKFLLALMEKVQSIGKLKALQLVISHFDCVSTDMPLGRAVSIVSTAFGITEEDIDFFTVPGNGKMNGSYAVYEVDREALAQILGEHFLPAAVEAEKLGFPRAEEPVVSQPEQEEEIPKESEMQPSSSQSSESDYLDPHGYDPWVDGDYDEWVERNSRRMAQRERK
ncbi:MAG: LCP family protein [Provencibacterium sp.]|nr:LCP family protein [Provencibacterium sp.]